MSLKNLNNFFEQFGTMQNEKTYPKETSIEAIVIDIAEKWDDDTIPGEGMFFDFSATPELQTPILDYLTKGLGWTLERPGFIRKPINTKTMAKKATTKKVTPKKASAKKSSGSKMTKADSGKTAQRSSGAKLTKADAGRSAEAEGAKLTKADAGRTAKKSATKKKTVKKSTAKNNAKL